MRNRSHVIMLSSEERKKIVYLKKILKTERGKNRCAIILAADEGNGRKRLPYEVISQTLNVSENTVISIVKSFCENGLSETLTWDRSIHSDEAKRKVDGRMEARIIAQACMPPPEGYKRWTQKLLVDELAVVLEEPLSQSTIQRVLDRNELRPHLDEYWCIPPKESAEFVCNMEDILDLYELEYDPDNPLWCVDEKTFQLLSDVREPLPLKKGSKTKIDCDYKREGTVCIFCLIQPHTGEIRQFVAETRTAIDWAEKIQWLLTEREPNAKQVRLVCDNLNTHAKASFYKAFSPSQARELAKKVDIHYTPVHGSWLDIAEIGICVMTRESLGIRIGDIDSLRTHLNAWENRHNSNPVPVKWQFRTKDARTKLIHLYPDIDRHKADRENLIEKKRKENSDTEDTE